MNQIYSRCFSAKILRSFRKHRSCAHDIVDFARLNGVSAFCDIFAVLFFLVRFARSVLHRFFSRRPNVEQSLRHTVPYFFLLIDHLCSAVRVPMDFIQHPPKHLILRNPGKQCPHSSCTTRKYGLQVFAISIMKLLSTAIALLALVTENDAFTLNMNQKGLHVPSNNILSQKDVIKMTTRETIKMPSQTPMVPWTVRACQIFLLSVYSLSSSHCF